MLALVAAGCAPKEKDRIALVGATVVDGTGAPVLPDAIIVVHQGTIETVAPREGFKIPKTALEVDVAGTWIIPGLIDSHVHVTRWALARYVAAGVTSVRDLHGQMDSILSLKEQVGLGGLVAPRIYSAGAMIDGTPATYSDATAVTTASQARRAVDDRAVKNVDVIKTYTRLTPDLMRAIIDEAGTFHLPVAAHLGLTDAITAAKLGVASIEHMTGVPEAASGSPDKFYAEHRASFFRGWNYFEKSWAGLDSGALARIAGTLVERRVSLVPTLVLHETFSRLDDSAVAHNPDLATVPDSEIKRWNVADLRARAGWDSATLVAFHKSRPMMDLFVREFRVAGGNIVAGTDATNQMLVPGLSLHSELELLVNAGLSPSDALLAATRNASRLLGADSIGVIAPGKVADLVVLAGNPLTDIRNTRKIQRVMVRGQLFSPDSLRASW